MPATAIKSKCLSGQQIRQGIAKIRSEIKKTEERFKTKEKKAGNAIGRLRSQCKHEGKVRCWCIVNRRFIGCEDCGIEVNVFDTEPIETWPEDVREALEEDNLKFFLSARYRRAVEKMEDNQPAPFETISRAEKRARGL